LCVQDDRVVVEAEGEGLFRFTCIDETQDMHPFVWWTRHGVKLHGLPQEGVGYDLGVYETLLGLFTPQDGYLEYGVVEDRFAASDPVAYRRLVDRYSHTAKERPLDYSASAFLASALGLLGREGLLRYRSTKATGYWSYNSRVFAWAVPGVDTATPTTTWVEVATERGIDPGDWPALDYRART
jgi:hypothetical protein